MAFDKSAALASLANDGVKADPEKLSAALDELFALQGGEPRGIDYHVHGGIDDHTSALDETVVTVWLIRGETDEHGIFYADNPSPNRIVPIVG